MLTQLPVDLNRAYDQLRGQIRNMSAAIPDYLRSDDDFDDVCSPFGASTDVSIACAYVRNHSEACEGGGFIAWTQAVVCQPDQAREALMLGLAVLWLFQLFLLLAVSADDFLAANIATLSEKLKISQSVAGVTLVAFGNGAPDIFSAIASAVSDDSPKAGLALGQLLGGGMFITTIVVPTVIMVQPLKVEPMATLRNLGFYVVALVWLAYVLFSYAKLKVYQPFGFLVIYVLYALTVVSGRMLLRLQKWREAKNAVFVRPLSGHNRSHLHSGHKEHATQRSHSLVCRSRTSSTTQPPMGAAPDAIYRDSVQVVSLSGQVAELEKSNSVLPSPAASDDVLCEDKDDDESLPCQDVTLKGIVVDLYEIAVDFDVAAFLDSSAYSKVYQILRNRWCKALALIHIFLAPQFLLLSFRLSAEDTMPLLQLWLPVLIGSTIAAVVVMACTSVDKEPESYKLVACAAGFAVSVGWVYLVCAEVIDVVEMLGVMSRLSPEVLGVTVLGWTNSIGDLVADVSLARQGYGQMAMAAAFGGPLFNLLIGFGLSFSIAVLQQKEVTIDLDLEKTVMFGFMCVSIAGSLTFLALRRFRANKVYEIGLYVVYACFMIVLILCETPILGVRSSPK